MLRHREVRWTSLCLPAIAAAALVLLAPAPALTDEGAPCPDLDGDGHAACDATCDATGLTCGDCDDSTAESHPGAAEVCNHQDDDCNGAVDETSAKIFAQQPLIDAGSQPGARFGASLALLGDIDGDGTPDLAVGAPTTDTITGNDAGAVVIMSGASRTMLCTATDEGGRPGDRLGTSVARLADLTGDGIPDVVSGAPGSSSPNAQGRVVIISGSDCSIVRSCTDSLLVTVPGGSQSQSYSELGTTVTSIGDINGDGIDEILAGDPNALNANISTLAPGSGRAAVFNGATCAVQRRLAPQLTGENNVRYGSAVANLGDLTGDGFNEYAVGSLLSPDTSNVLFGKVRVFSGFNGALIRTLADLSPEASRGGMGGAIAVLPDITGDGIADIAAGEAQGDDAETLDAGAVVLFSGADGALLRRCTAPDGLGNDQLGRALAALPDLDGDGIAEVAASAPLDDTPRGNDAGSVVIFSAATCDVVTRLWDNAGLPGSRLADRSILFAGDLLADPEPDFIAGSGYDASNAGTVPGRALMFGTESDCDGDGTTPTDGDCDDADPATGPGLGETCDGLDNDCDFEIDEEEPIDGLPCTTGLPGVCSAGLTRCGLEPYACVPEVEPSGETCDGLDNDCDGEVDDGVQGGEPCSTGLPGVCAAGTTACDASGPACVPDVPASDEICDLLDNDCDGEVDDGDPGGGEACSTGQPGACSSGLTECSGGTIVCVTGTGTPEVCDGIDNDCNGSVDEGNPGGGAACSTGLPGLCATGVRECTGGALACIATSPSAEVCDLDDNDCDGFVDDNDPGGGQSCATGQQGVCAPGTVHCVAGDLGCVRDVDPSAEVCDGLDNDCDGAVDEGNPGAGVACETNLEGVCSLGTQRCNDGVLSCVPNIPASPEVCDGFDNDCDGNVDDVDDHTDGDGIGDCIDNCLNVPNPDQADGDFDGHGDACDTCPAVQNHDQDICACNLCGVVNPVIDRPTGGVSMFRWSTDMEHAIVGFNLIETSVGAKETRLNSALIPCQQCTTDMGAGYMVPLPKTPGGNKLYYVEQVGADGSLRRFGPAARL